ncbi:Major facilitator superfamily (MFS) profile domain-containing protein [Entamoeba marina]
MRLGVLAFIIAILFPLFILDQMWALYVSMVIYGVGGGFFWAVIIGSVGKEAPKGQENLRSSVFSVSWSIGKSFGYLFGGLLKGILGINSFYIAMGCLVIILIIYPIQMENNEEGKSRSPSGSGDDGFKNVSDIEIDIEGPNSPIGDLDLKKKKFKWEKKELKNKTYIYLGYILNFAIKGTNWVISSQYIKLAKRKDVRINLFDTNPNEMFVGVFFFFLYIAQTTALGFLSISTKWAYRRSLILGGLTITACLYITMAMSENIYVLCAMAFISGLTSGFSNQTAVFYSLRASTKNKGVYVGLSELTAGTGMAFLPLLGGLVATHFDNFYVPLYINLIVVISCMILFDIVYRVMLSIDITKTPSTQPKVDDNMLNNEDKQSDVAETEQNLDVQLSINGSDLSDKSSSNGSSLSI